MYLSSWDINYILYAIEREFGYEVADEVAYGLYIGEVLPYEWDMWDAAEDYEYEFYILYKTYSYKPYYKY